MFSSDILEKIAYIQPPRKELGSDACAWGRTNNNTFTTKTVFEACIDINNNIQHDRWKEIWSLKVPEWIQIFIWQVHWEGLKTKKFLFQRHLCDPFCNDYIGNVESLTHALRDCNTIRNIWITLLNKSKKPNLFNSNVHDWIHLNMNQNLNRNPELQWQKIWATTSHCIWLWHNKWYFDDQFIMPPYPVSNICKLLHQYTVRDVADSKEHQKAFCGDLH